ncbi:CGI-121-domain-containing protein [Filobasidium floriforme]|uniref:CGI-121-domain-containing protein n=1 Tax=Filobasidium floriforme TaxID=5210 RepID=UPI001E8ED5EC|nr:CGI-121-domain-containing protein [Filobasidium floriforme]KAH8083561.1 CGI-121-domain-containing protein [Filobasidium floriforme]
MESYHLSQFPDDHSSVHLAFFKNVTNSADLRKRLVAAATMEGEEGDQERDLLDYAFVEANMIVDREQLLTAIYSALQAASSGPLKTKTLHSEVLLSLHPSATPQINEALRKFGISATTKNLILVRIGPPSLSSITSTSTSLPLSSDEDAKAEHEQKLVDAMSDLVEGEMTSLSQLRESDVDWKGLKKLYKLNEMNLAPNAPSTEAEKDMLAAVITSTIATKTVAG